MATALSEICGDFVDALRHEEAREILSFGRGEIRKQTEIANTKRLCSEFPLQLFIEKLPAVDGVDYFQVAVFKNSDTDENLDLETLLLSEDAIAELNLPPNMPNNLASFMPLTRAMVMEVIAATGHTAEKIHAERWAAKFDRAAAVRGERLAELLKTPAEKRAEEFRSKFTVLDGGKSNAPTVG